MSFLKNLFSGPYKPVNSLEKALQDVIANPKSYETFHKELLNSEIFILGNVTQEGHLNLMINPLENFSVLYLFTSEEILRFFFSLSLFKLRLSKASHSCSSMFENFSSSKSLS